MSLLCVLVPYWQWADICSCLYTQLGISDWMKRKDGAKHEYSSLSDFWLYTVWLVTSCSFYLAFSFMIDHTLILWANINLLFLNLLLLDEKINCLNYFFQYDKILWPRQLIKERLLQTYSFQWWVHDHDGGKHGSRQEAAVLKQKLRACTLIHKHKARRKRDILRNGMNFWNLKAYLRHCQISKNFLKSSTNWESSK